jgi:ketosteroid isomerase-like protein
MPPGAQGESSFLPERLNAALNAHDLEAFLACFHPDYESEQPAHPDRAFQGREQVRTNWAAVFEGVPDFRSQLVRAAVDGDVVWSEWRWRGTQSDGSALDMAGVMVCDVRDGQMSSARLYIEPVEETGAGIDAAVRRMTGDEPEQPGR